MFRTVTNEIRLVRSIVAGIRAFADLMAESFTRRVTGYLREGEELPAGFLSLLQRVVARLIEGDRDRLVAAEKLHRDALRAESQLRKHRDKEADDLYQKLLKVRKTLEAFGPGTSVTYLGLDPRLGNADPQVLLRYAHESVDVMSDPGFEPPAGTDPNGKTFHPDEHVAEITPALARAEGTVDELEDQKRETQKALKEKTQALETFRESSTYGSRFHESLYVLAGERFHAARLRPNVGRGGSVEPDPFSFAEPDSLPDTGDGEPGTADGEPSGSAADEADDSPEVDAAGHDG